MAASPLRSQAAGAHRTFRTLGRISKAGDAENLFRKATGDGREAVTAAIFWLKARAQWKETSVSEQGGLGGAPIEHVQRIERVILTGPHPDQLAARPRLANGTSAAIDGKADG